MKKKYNAPKAEFVELKVDAILTTASLYTEEEEKGNSNYSTSGEVRNDWDNIWSGM
ncbi:MAG: hypothetical protein IKJ95_03115 [Bacteroidaceae bacterium]|nr:hypothetical protein [Bacteroidaceae bacterium]